MIRALMQKLGLDRLGDVVADEIRRVQIEVLREERDVLAGMIAKFDERIAGLGGKRRGRPPKAAAAAIVAPTRRPGRRRIVHRAAGESLRDMVAYALAKAGGPVKATTLVDLVQEVGYKTTAKRSTLLTSIYHVLADTKVFKRFGKGVFGLVAAPATPAKPVEPPTPIGRKSDETLLYFVLRAFRKARTPVKVGHLVKRVREFGYRTASSPKNLLLRIYGVLRNETLFRKVGGGFYALALPAPKREKVRRPRKRARATETPATATRGATSAEAKPTAAEVNGE